MSHVKNDVFVSHPGGAENSVSSCTVILKCVAPPCSFPFPVQVGVGFPCSTERSEVHRDCRKLFEIGDLPTMPLLCCAAATVASAITLDATLQGVVGSTSHVRISGTTIDDRPPQAV